MRPLELTSAADYSHRTSLADFHKSLLVCSYSYRFRQFICTIIMANDSDCRTALHRAVEDADVEKVRQLVLDGANVNARDVNGQIPMPRHPSILQNVPQQVEILELLVQAGADLTSYDSNADLQVADILRYGTRELVRIIVQANISLSAEYAEYSPLHYLAENKNAGIVEELRRKPFVFKMCGDFNSLQICTAIEEINPRMVEFFFKNGFESHNTHFAFLAGACIYERTEEIIEVVALLLEYKVDPLANFDNILTFHRNKPKNSKLKTWPVIKQVVAHLAVQEHFERLNDQAYDLIGSVDDVEHYYQLSKKQLDEMMTKTICDSFTFFDLLVSNEEKCILLASNRKLVLKLKDIAELPRWNEFYGRIIQKRVETILKVVEYRKRSVTIICTILGKLYQSNDLISEKIVSFLNHEDIEKLYLFSS